MGAKLAPSRERGVLVMASGNVVHNLRAMDWNLADKGYDWAKRFDQDAKELILSDPADAAPLEGHTDFRAAVPTPDHFLPWLHLAGMASVATDKPDILVAATTTRSAPKSHQFATTGTTTTKAECSASHQCPYPSSTPMASASQGFRSLGILDLTEDRVPILSIEVRRAASAITDRIS